MKFEVFEVPEEDKLFELYAGATDAIGERPTFAFAIPIVSALACGGMYNGMEIG